MEVVKRQFYNADEVATIMGISKSFAYKFIRQANEELIAMGKYVVNGKVNKEYFDSKIYGGRA